VPERVGQQRLELPADHREAADLAVVHEQERAAGERVAVGQRDAAAGGRAHMGEEQMRTHMGGQRQQVLVAPGRRHLAVDARRVAVAVPADAEAVAVGDHLGLLGAQALAHQRVLGPADQVLEIDRITAVGKESAHAGILPHATLGAQR